MVIVNAAGQIVLVNSQTEKLFGYTRAELLGRPVEILVPERLGEGHARHRETYMARPHTRPMGVGLDLAGRHKDGRDIPVEISLSPLQAKGGPLGDVLITAVIRDVTHRKKMEADLRNHAQQQAIVAELGRRALSGIDVYMLMDEAAGVLARVLGVELCGVWELLPSGDALRLQAGFGWATNWPSGVIGQAAIAAGTEAPEGYALQTRQAVVVEDFAIDSRFRGPPLFRDHHVVGGMAVVIYGPDRPFGVLAAYATQRRRFSEADVYFLQSVANVLAAAVERKRNELAQRERDLQRADQLAILGQVAAGVGHELRNPLTSIKGLVQVNLKEASARGLPVEDLRIIEQEIRRMERTLQMFLDFARPAKPERRRVELASLVERVFALVAGRAAKQRVVLGFQPPAGPVTVQADQDQIQQLLLNLILNALDAMPHGGDLSVTLGSDRDEQVEIEVADHGPGIPAELLPRIFEPFVTSKEAGLGLGLAVSRRIAQDHGGSLGAVNRPGGGACFTLLLPAAPASPSPLKGRGQGAGGPDEG